MRSERPLLLLLSLGWSCGLLLATLFSFDQKQAGGAWEVESEKAACSSYISKKEVCLCGGNYFSRIKERSLGRNTEKGRKKKEGREGGRKEGRARGREKEGGKKKGKCTLFSLGEFIHLLIMSVKLKEISTFLF